MPATMQSDLELASQLRAHLSGGQVTANPSRQGDLELASQLRAHLGLSQPAAQPSIGQPAPVASAPPTGRPAHVGANADADNAQKLLYRLPYMTDEAKQDPAFLKEWQKAHESVPAGDAKQLQASKDELWVRAADRAQAAQDRLASAKEAADRTGPSMPRLGIGPGAFTADRAQADMRQRELRNAEQQADEADEFERSVRSPAWARQYANWAVQKADPKMLANKRYGEDFKSARKMLAESKDPGDKAILMAMDLKDASIAKYRQGMAKHYKTAANLLEVHDDRGELKRRLRQVPANERPLVLDAMDELLSETDTPESARPGFGTRLSESYRAGVKQIEDSSRRYFGDETPEETETLRQISGIVNREFSPSRETDPWLDRELQKTAQMVMPMAAMAGGGRLLGGAAKAAGAGKAVAGFATAAGVTGAAFPFEYTEMLDMAAEQGIDPQIAAQVAPWAALASSMVETILPDPWGPGSVSLKGGVYKAVAQTLTEHLMRAGVETVEEGIQGGIKGAGLVAASWLDENAPDMRFGQAFQNAWDDLTESIVPMGILAGGPGLVRAPAAGVAAKKLGEQRAKYKEFLESYHPARQSMREAHFDPEKGGFTKISLPDAEAALDELENKPELTAHEEKWRDYLRGMIADEEQSRSSRRAAVAKSRKKRLGDNRRARIQELVEANRQRLQARQDFRQYMEGDEWEKDAEEWEAGQSKPAEDPDQKDFERLVAESDEALKDELESIWNAKAKELGEEERKLYREFYTTPGTAYEWAEKNPEAAQKLADSPTYRIADFKAVDADLPEFDDPAARKQWKEWVKQSVGVPDDVREALRGPEMQGGKLTHEWQKIPEGVKPPQSLAVEVLETPGGTLARLRTAEKIAAKLKSTTARQRLQARQDFRQYMGGDEWEKDAEEWEAGQSKPAEDPDQKDFERLVAESDEALKSELESIWNAKAKELGEEERKLYRKFYTTPGTAYEWAEKNPEAAQKLADSPTYRIADFKAVDADLPEFDDPAARKQWKEWVKQSLGVPDDVREALRGPEMQDGKLTHEWQKIPEGVKPPQSLAVEVLETPGGTLVRLRTAEKIANAKQKSTTARPDAGVPGPGAPGTAGEGGKTGTGPGDVPTVSSGGPGSGPLAESVEKRPNAGPFTRENVEKELLALEPGTIIRSGVVPGDYWYVVQKYKDKQGKTWLELNLFSVEDDGTIVTGPKTEHIIFGPDGKVRKTEAYHPFGSYTDAKTGDRHLTVDEVTSLRLNIGSHRVILKSKEGRTDVTADAHQYFPGAATEPAAAGKKPPIEGWDVVPDDARELFENEVLGNLRETVGRLDDAASKLGAVRQRAARDMAGNEPPGENIGKAGLDRFKEQAKQAGLDPDELLASHDEYQDLLGRLAKYQGEDRVRPKRIGSKKYTPDLDPQIDQMLLDGVPADKVAESLGIPASIVQRRESGLIPPAEQATEAPKKPTKSLAEMVGETRKRLGTKKADTAPPSESPSSEVVNLPTEAINLDPSRFQFKAGTTATGEVAGEELAGDWNPRAAGVILAWQDKDGQYWAVNGHHRTALAKRLGVETMAAHVVRESDGVTADAARALGAELNILEGQGTVDDYAQFFREASVSEEDARQRGLLARPKGQTGFLVGKFASDDVWAAFRAGKIRPAVAAAIADGGRGDEGLQAAGLKEARSGASAEKIRHFLNALKLFPRSTDKDKQGTLFEIDDSAIREAEQIAAAVQEIVKPLNERRLAVQSAMRRPEEAKAMGLTGDYDAIKAEYDRIVNDMDRWSRWYTDPDLVREARIKAGLTADWRQPPKEDTASDKPDPDQQDMFGGKKKSLDDISEDDLIDDILGNTPAPTEPPQQKKKRADDKKSPRPKRDRKLGEMAKKATSEAVDAFNEFGNILGKRGISMNPMADPELQRAAAKLTVKLVKAGVLNFANFIDMAVQNLGRELVERIGPLLENAWTHIYNKFEPEGMTPAGNVAEILKEKKDEKEEETDESEEAEGDAGPGDDVGGSGGAGVGGAIGEKRLITVRDGLGTPGDTGVLSEKVRQYLKPHQADGAARAIRAMTVPDRGVAVDSGGFLLADGTGAGKTAEILAVADHFVGKGKKVLIVAPSQVLGSPFSNKRTISGSYATDSVAMGVPLNLIRDAEAARPGINITTYHYLDDVLDMVDDNVVLIFDEAHALKNQDSRRAQVGMEMLDRAYAAMFATATPADKPEHLHYLRRIGILEGRDYDEQMRKLGLKKQHSRQGTFWVVDESVGAEEVHNRMEDLFTRITKQDGMLKRELSMNGVRVDFEELELPDEARDVMQKIHDVFTDNGRLPFEGMRKAIVRMHQRRQQEPYKVARTVAMIKEELAKGRSVVVYASRVNWSEAAKKIYTTDPITGKRVMVGKILAAQSEGTMRLLREALNKEGISDIAELHGGSKMSSTEAQERFQSGKARVLLATIESGGQGINLDDRTGNAPRTLIVMTAPFSSVENVQAAGRVWRMLTKSFPTVRYLFGDTTVDRWNRGIIATKMAMLEAVVSGDVGQLNVDHPDFQKPSDSPDVGLGGLADFRYAAKKAGWTEEEVEHGIALIEARAEVLGMSVNDWVATRIAEVKGYESEREAPNYGGQQVYQRNLAQAQGMVELLDDGRAVIRGFNGKNVSTLVHELGHVFRKDLTPDELATVEQWAGVQQGRWTLGLEEQFARAFERWLREGKTTNPKLVSIFQKFKEWLTAIYSKLKNSPIQVRLGPEIRSLFDTMLGGTGEAVEVSGPDAGTSGPETGYSNVRQTKSQVPRKPGDDADGIAAQDIIKTWERIFKVPIRAGGFFSPRKDGHGKVGIYKFWPEIARIAEDYIGSLAVAMHEIAHHIDNTNKLFQPGSGAPLNVPQAEANEVAGLDYDKDKARTFEGFAEYLRMWITEPEINVSGQMKSPAEIGAPMFHAWFQTKFLPTKPELAAQIKKAREHAQRYSDQSIFQRLKTLIAERLGNDLDWSEQWKADIKSKTAGMIIAKHDRFYGLTLADRLAKKRGWHGISVYDTALFYALSEHSNAAVAAAEGVFDIRRGPTEKIGTASLHGLARHLKSDVEAPEAKLYAFARHTLFMVQKNPHYRTAMDFEDAQGWVEHIKQDPDKHRRFEAFAKELARYNNDLLDMLVLAGHLDPEERDRMQKYYGGYYMPLHRVGHKQTGGGAGFVNLPHGFKARSKYGSDRPIVDPIEASLKKTIDAYKLAAGARVSIRLAEMLDPQLGGVKGAGGLMDRVDPKMVAHKGTIKEVLSTLVKEELIDADYARELRIAARILDGETIPQRSIEWFANRHGIDLTAPDADTKLEKAAKSLPDIMTEIALWRQDFTPNADKAIVRICRNGEKIMYQLDRILHETATQNGMNRSYGAFMRAAIKMSRGFKMAVVGVSSAFAPANLVADFQEYQGKAKHVKGLGSITKPIARLIGYTAYHFGRQSEKAALYREYEAMAGKLYSQLGPDIGSRRRSAKRMLGKTVWSRMGLTFQDGSVFGHLKDAFAGGVDAYAETLAISDAPPRLAEAEAVIREHGFESRGTKWYNIHTGRPVSGLPEEVRIAAARAMGEATVNFKRFGTDREVMEAFLPFSNAAIQAMTRQGRQWANLQNLFKKTPGGQRTREAAEAQRLLVYYTALAAQTVLYWLWRRDDDDWKEQEPWLKDNYWTWGANGRTYFRARKPRQDAVFSNLIIALLESGSRDGRDFGDVLLQDVEGRLPTGGGLLRGAVEALVADYDYFRGRDLTPSHLEEEPTELQYMGDTDALSILLSDKLGKHIGLSPIKIRHLMDSASGGWYADATKVLTGQGGWEDIPFVSGFGLNRHQATSINQFYERQKETKRQRSREKAAGSISNETAMEHARLAQYADLMADIRALEPRQLGRRTYKYQPMLAGLARKALGKEQLVNNPDPFYADVPDEVRTILDKFVDSRIDTAVLSHGLPEKTKEGDTDYAETLANWEAKRAAHTEWLREHKDSPVVKSALDRAKKKKSFRDLITWKGFATPPKRAKDESLADYRARYAAFRSKRSQAVKWLGENFD